MATDTDAQPEDWFIEPARWADMERWHREVGAIRRAQPVLLVDRPGYEPFWVLTRHEDVFAVSLNNDLWHNTTRSVLGPDADFERMVASGMPPPKTLVHIDGDDHRQHRAVTNDWFKPAAVGKRQPHIDDIADEYVQRMRDLGGRCDFARDVAQPATSCCPSVSAPTSASAPSSPAASSAR